MNTAANLKQNLKKSAKSFTDEPLELLKAAKRQIAPENEYYPEEQSQIKSDSEIPQDEQQYKIQKAESEGRTLQALENEIKDIRRQKLFNDLIARIQNGEDVPLEEFIELSFEQKDVLKAQMEAVRTRNAQPITDQLVEPVSKKGRQLFGQKQSAQKQTTRVEKPVPPSG